MWRALRVLVQKVASLAGGCRLGEARDFVPALHEVVVGPGVLGAIRPVGDGEKPIGELASAVGNAATTAAMIPNISGVSSVDRSGGWGVMRGSFVCDPVAAEAPARASPRHALTYHVWPESGQVPQAVASPMFRRFDGVARAGRRFRPSVGHAFTLGRKADI